MSRRPARTRPGGTSALAPRVEPLTVGPSAPEPDSGSPAASTSQTSGVPRYLQLHRRDVRLREDQIDALAALRRRIARARPPGQRDERITDNTLVRVAIDLLLEYRDQLSGATEDEIRESAVRAAKGRRRRP